MEQHSKAANTTLWKSATDMAHFGDRSVLAASHFNALVNALAVHVTTDTLAEHVHTAWDVWGSREELLTLSAEDIRQYIATVLGLPV